jgi:hypothetical protein
LTRHSGCMIFKLLTVPPIALGALSMALVLWQLPEYYYYFRCLRARLYGDNPGVQQSQSQIASGLLQGVAGGRGELRCLWR